MSRKTGRSRPHRQHARGARSTASPPLVATASAAAPPSGWAASPLAAVKWLLWGTATLTLFYVCYQWIMRQITWYLAVDQFGYLTFANDLLHGHVFHEWPPMKALEGALPTRTDVLVQTYVYDQGRMYCRYSPGFPMLLASWIRLLGPDRAHYLNPSVYLVLLAVALAFQRRIFRSPWRAAAGTALITLFPTMMHLWGLTLTRDLAAHLFALIGLYLLLPIRGRSLGTGRLLGAGLALGFTITIRPDGVLYLASAATMLALRWWHERRRRDGGTVTLAAALVGGLLLGTSPLLVYNWVATGNPLIPTQGMELPLLPKLPPPAPRVLPPPPTPPAPAQPKEPKVGYPSPGWRGGTFDDVQGGGLRVKHFRTTFPGNWRLAQRAYTPMLFWAAVWGAVVAMVMRPMLAAAAIPYCLLAFLFFSLWPRPDFRYLIGVFVFLPMLVIEGTMGTLDLVRLLWRRRNEALARGLGAFAATALLLGALLWRSIVVQGGLSQHVFLSVTLIAGIAAAVSAIWPRRRIAALAAPALLLALVWCKATDVQALASRRAPFQRPQVLEARANMQRLLEPNSVVISTEEVGRPAENIEYYSDVASAFYLTDLERWRLPLATAALRLILHGKRPYLFIPTGQTDKGKMLDDLRAANLTVDLVADIPANRAMAHFVAAPFHRGVRMELYRISQPAIEELLRRTPAVGHTP